MNFDVDKCLIFMGITGSRLYGTETENSDFDYRGCCVPPLEVVLDPFMNFEQKDSGFEEKDKTIFALSKFFKLCADSNPNIIEMLFIPESKTNFKTKEWDLILENKRLFLSKKAKYTFSGYAISQLNAIKTHRKWFVNPPKEKPTRKMFGLTDEPKISGEGLLAVSNIKFDLLNDAFADEVRREIEYREQKKSWDNYVSWRDNRNPVRRELEDKFGFDCKHGSHLIRLMTEGKELLLTGNITFPLPNCEEIKAIKNGKYSYEEIIDMAETMDKNFELWYDQSNLPHHADINGLTELYINMILKK